MLYRPNSTQQHTTCKPCHLYIKSSSIDKANKAKKSSSNMLKNTLYNCFLRHILNNLLDRLHMTRLLLILLESNLQCIVNILKHLRIAYNLEWQKNMFCKYFLQKYPNKKLLCIWCIEFNCIKSSYCMILNKVDRWKSLDPNWILGNNSDISLIHCIFYNFKCKFYI